MMIKHIMMLGKFLMYHRILREVEPSTLGMAERTLVPIARVVPPQTRHPERPSTPGEGIAYEASNLFHGMSIVDHSRNPISIYVNTMNLDVVPLAIHIYVNLYASFCIHKQKLMDKLVSFPSRNLAAIRLETDTDL